MDSMYSKVTYDLLASSEFKINLKSKTTYMRDVRLASWGIISMIFIILSSDR